MRHLPSLAVFLHGPFDLLVTASFWELEANPLVLELGIGRWLLVKVLMLVAFAVVLVVWNDQDWTYDASFVLVLLAAVAVVPNALVI